MTKIKYNVKGVDRGGTFEQPQPGLYEMEIKEANPRLTDGKNDIELVLEITKNNTAFVGSRVWSYVSLGEASQWKLAELTDALGLPEQGDLDTAKLTGKKMKVKVNGDSWNNEYRARAGRFAPLEAEGTEADLGDDPDASVEAAVDGERNEGGDAEHIVTERNGVELSTDPDYYDDWSEQDAIDEIENQGLELGRKKKNKANVIAAIIELLQSEASGDPNQDAVEAEADGEDNYDDTEAWDDKAIAAEFKKRGLTVEGKLNRTKAIEAMRADDANDDPFADD